MKAKRNPSASKGSKRAGVLERLDRLGRNLLWSWDVETQRLFASVDPLLWDATYHNPLQMLSRLTPERVAAIENDADFAQRLNESEQRAAEYMSARTWFERVKPARGKTFRVAYFSAEFAVSECMQQYAGGLGVLAGDHLKSASDLGVPLVGVGLLYRSGYYRQQFAADGATRVTYPSYNFEQLPIVDTGCRVAIPLGKREVTARVWRMDVGRTPLLLLDTDTPENRGADRAITATLYGGDNETRIQQEIVLGIGGVRALEALGLKATVFHLNEGHAAFCGLERLRGLVARGEKYERAFDSVRTSTVFTTHTPVAAGHDRFSPQLTMKYLAPIADALSLNREQFMRLGRENPRDTQAPFCMTALALRLSDRRNGVAALHGETTRKMWKDIFGVARHEDTPIGHVTNGVHSQTWIAPEIAPLYTRYLKPRWLGAGPRDDWWKNADRIPARDLWAIRQVLRQKLVHFVRQRLSEQALKRGASAGEVAEAYSALREDALTIGFARRFATYKRAPLIFQDIKRLSRILCDEKRPVQLLFAGKAHPRDADGQRFAQLVYQHARNNGFRGRVAIIEEYDIHVGRMLISGCDVWLNNPIRPMEASGTSGMKPPLHGGLNFSILDGWWPEAYNGKNGWAIGDDRKSAPAARDKNDAAAIYQLLEREAVPLFFRRDSAGLPQAWITRMRESMKTVCAEFSSHRMVGEYVEKYYVPANS